MTFIAKSLCLSIDNNAGGNSFTLLIGAGYDDTWIVKKVYFAIVILIISFVTYLISQDLKIRNTPSDVTFMHLADAFIQSDLNIAFKIQFYI